MTLEKLIEKNYNDLNQNDLYIWQYILYHKKECQKMSIHDLANVCSISPTSILRFTKKLGLDGYSELKIYLKWELENKKNFDQSMINETIHEFKQTLTMMQERDLDNSLEMIDKAERIFIYGTGDVEVNVVNEMRREFSYCQKMMHIVEGTVELDTVLNTITSNDLFILVSYSGNNEVVVTLSKALKRMRVKTLAICKDSNNFLSKNSDEVIGFKTSSFYTGNFDTVYFNTGQFFLITNLLFLKYLQYKDNRGVKYG